MTTPQTTQEYLDWFAEREGWKYERSGDGYRMLWFKGDGYALDHPLPATLDTAAMLFKKYLPGWTWTRVWVTCPYSREWYVFKDAEFQFKIPDTGDELHDRLALVYKALNAKEKA